MPMATTAATAASIRVAYGKPEHKNVDLKTLSDSDLAELVLDKNDWYVRHSRRILQERAAAGKLDALSPHSPRRNRDHAPR